MKYYLLLVYVTAGLVALYYLTVLLHIFFGSFGKHVDVNKAFIPFYGWFAGLKGDKSNKAQDSKTAPAKSASEHKKNKKKL